MTANETQIGGTHYKDMAVQPWDAMRNFMTPDQYVGYLLGSAVNYLMRYNAVTPGKGGLDDVRKAHHTLAKLIETLDPPFAVKLDKSVRDSLLDKYKDGVPAGEAMPHTATMPRWTICDADGNPISWPPSGIFTHVRSPVMANDAMKRATADALHDGLGVLRFNVDGSIDHVPQEEFRAPDWPGPDWSRAPEWAVFFQVTTSQEDAFWLETEPVITVGVDVSGITYGQGRQQRCSTFGYTGEWRDSLRKRPETPKCGHVMIVTKMGRLCRECGMSSYEIRQQQKGK